jgi:hypothetical protein
MQADIKYEKESGVMGMCALDNLPLNASTLVKNSMKAVWVNQRELTIDSETMKESLNWICGRLKKTKYLIQQPSCRKP